MLPKLLVKSSGLQVLINPKVSFMEGVFNSRSKIYQFNYFM